MKLHRSYPNCKLTTQERIAVIILRKLGFKPILEHDTDGVNTFSIAIFHEDTKGKVRKHRCLFSVDDYGNVDIELFLGESLVRLSRNELRLLRDIEDYYKRLKK